MIWALLLFLQAFYPQHPPRPTAGGGSSLTATFHSGSNGGCSSGSTTCANTLAVTAGDMIFCYVGSTTVPSTLACSDSDGDSFTSAAGQASLATKSVGQMFVAIAGTTNAAEVVTATCSLSTNHMSGSVLVLTPSTTPVLDKSPAGATYSVTTAMTTSASGTLAQANEVVVAGFSMFNDVTQLGAPTAGGSFVNGQYSFVEVASASDTFIMWQGVSSTGTITGTAAANANLSGVGHIVTYRGP